MSLTQTVNRQDVRDTIIAATDPFEGYTAEKEMGARTLRVSFFPDEEQFIVEMNDNLGHYVAQNTTIESIAFEITSMLRDGVF